MQTLVRCTIPAEQGRPEDLRRILRGEVRYLLALPAFQALRAEYHAGRYYDPPAVGPEVRLTLVLQRQHLHDVRRLATDALPASVSVIEIPDDRILAQDCGWYRQALQRITDVGLEVLSSDGPPPVVEPDWSLGPPNQEAFYAERLSPWLARYSPTFRGSEDQGAFWTEFFRWGPSRELSPPGHWLWNIAG